MRNIGAYVLSLQRIDFFFFRATHIIRRGFGGSTFPNGFDICILLNDTTLLLQTGSICTIVRGPFFRARKKKEYIAL